MATFSQRVTDLAIRIATECKALRNLVSGGANDLSALTTTNKSNLVAALNELDADLAQLAAASGATINDAATTSTTQTYSIDKIKATVTAAISALTSGAPTAMDTLDELAAALGDDANFAATITAALGNRVRTDTAAQGLDATQKANARANIGADITSAEIGNPDTNFVATFNANLS